MKASRPSIVIAALVLIVAGCSGSSDKAGGSAEKSVVLTLADHETGALDVDEWIREVESLSSGTLRIELLSRWREKELDYDRGTIEDVRGGRVDIAKIAARSWDDAGVSTFRALMAPLLVDSYAVEEQVLASDLSAEMLAGVETRDLVGLAVLPGLLRKPLGVKRVLRRPEDFIGARIGVRPGGVARMTFAALGAESVPYVAGDRTAMSQLDGAELDVDVIAGNAFDRGALALTANVNLWPRALTLVMNRRVFDALSRKQKEALRSAADNALARAMKSIADLDQHTAQTLCRRGLRFVKASPSELAAFRAELRSVYAGLEKDTQTRALIDGIRDLKRRLGDAATADPPGCVRAGPAAGGRRSPIDGVYRSTVTRQELLRHPRYEEGEDNSSNYGQFTLTIRAGRFEWLGSADGIPMGGTLIVNGDQVKMRPTHPPEVVGLEFVYQWSRYRNVLSFTKVTAGPTLLVVHPWRPA